MNYNEIVNRFQEIVEDHKMLVDFGYGQISDIKTRSEGGGESEGTDYPYLFLNPGTHQRTQQTITYNFNMIIMDMAREEEADEYQNFLNIQSDCIQYCDDVIARLYYHYKDKPEISFDVSYTPFYERFQDQLAGATAVITIQVPNPINECIAPFSNETLINRVFVNVEECPAYDTAFDIVSDVPNFPDYPLQFNEFYARFDEPAPFEDCDAGKTPLAINNRNSTTEPYYNAGDRHWKIPAGVEGVFHLDFDLLLKNVQGIDLSEDRLWVQLVINGQTRTYYDLPELPIDGTPVPFNQRFTVDASSDEDEFTILFRYEDRGTPAPYGPLVGYTGTAEIYQVD